MIAGGIVAMLAFQVIVNVGMNLGLMPVTGITLPLISYGGSSVLGTFLALGLLQASTPSRAGAASAAKLFQVSLRLGATLGSLEGSPQAIAEEQPDLCWAGRQSTVS